MPSAKRARTESDDTVCVGIVFSVEGCDYKPVTVPVTVPAAKELGAAAEQLSPLQKAVHGLYHKRIYRAVLWSEGNSDPDLEVIGALYKKALDAQDEEFESWTETPDSVTELTCAWLHYALYGDIGDGGVAPPGVACVISFEIPQE